MNPLQKLYVNDLFVFDLEQSKYYSHYEIIYRYLKESLSSQNAQLLTKDQSKSNILIEQEEIKNEETDDIKEESQSKLTELQIHQFSIEEDLNEVEYILNTHEQDLLKHADKQNFMLFQAISKAENFSKELKFEEFFRISMMQNKSEKIFYKLAIYIHYREKGYELESGSLFGFDFLLYEPSKTEENGILNKKQRTHSNYAIHINYSDDPTQIDNTFVDVQRKHMIAKNYNKKLLLVSIQKVKGVELIKLLQKKSIQEYLGSFEIENIALKLERLKK